MYGGEDPSDFSHGIFRIIKTLLENRSNAVALGFRIQRTIHRLHRLRHHLDNRRSNPQSVFQILTGIQQRLAVRPC